VNTGESVSEQYETMLERQMERYGRIPRQVSADEGFASKDNLEVRQAPR
jgi:transposase, IS5 family